MKTYNIFLHAAATCDLSKGVWAAIIEDEERNLKHIETYNDARTTHVATKWSAIISILEMLPKECSINFVISDRLFVNWLEKIPRWIQDDFRNFQWNVDLVHKESAKKVHMLSAFKKIQYFYETEFTNTGIKMVKQMRFDCLNRKSSSIRTWSSDFKTMKYE